jgi:lipoprotein-anchoring transpeptidase ErfK/SrfK
MEESHRGAAYSARDELSPAQSSRRLRNSPQPVGPCYPDGTGSDPVHTGTPLAPQHVMRPSPLLALVMCCAGLTSLAAVRPAALGEQGEPRYRIETRADRSGSLRARFSESQLAILEKLNRADVAHLEQLREVVVPESWTDDERSYSALPMRYPSSEASPTFLVVYLPGQLFGAYEFGSLVRWGPVSSGSRNNPTSPGTFALNWRSTGRTSTVDPDWFMRWYFNFSNREGLALHAYSLPGYPASHGCIRLLERDAQWLYEWGQTWMLEPGGTRVLTRGTPVFIVGRYDFDAAPPWRSPTWLSATVELPSASMTDIDISGRRP